MDLAHLYRNIVEASPDGIWVVDLTGRSVYTNPEIARIHGVGVRDLGALTIFDTLDAAGRLQLAEELELASLGRIRTTVREVQWVRRDGSLVPMLVTVSPMRASTGAALLVRHYRGRTAEGSGNPDRSGTFTAAAAGLRPTAGEPATQEPGRRRLVARSAPPVPAAPPPAPMPVKGRVLVVEDNPVNQMVATGLLTNLGYASEVAEDGAAGVEAVLSGAFDAVLMDVQMPRMDGYTATRAIRAAERGVRLPIIAMTAAAIAGERERCLEAGMDDFLTKPVDPASLAETLSRWAGQAPQPVSPAPSYADRLDVTRLDELHGLTDPGEASYLERAIDNFIGGAADDLARMASAVAGGDVATLRSVAHRFAGAALNLGAVVTGEAARGVEVLAVEHRLGEAASEIDRVALLLEEDLGALRRYARARFAPQAS